MVFEDLLYPDNPERRQEVNNYQAKFRLTFEDFKASWNKMCTSFNDVVQEKKPDWVLQTLSYDPHSQDAEYILNEIKKVLEDTKAKVPKIESDIGIKDISGVLENKDVDKIKNIAKWIDGTIGIFAGEIIIPVFTVIFRVVTPILGKIIGAIAGVVGGVLGAVFVGATAMVIVDAIVGAIERKELEDAITEFKKFDNDCIVHLVEARRKIDGINQNITDGFYPIDDTYVIKKGKLKKLEPVD